MPFLSNVLTIQLIGNKAVSCSIGAIIID